MTEATNFIFEDSREGRSLVATGPWSEEAARALTQGQADGLVLNYARGFREGNLDFLDESWDLRRLDVLDRTILDLDPIARFGHLEALSVQAAPGAALDLGELPDLRTVTGDWPLIAPTLSALTELESIVTWEFDEPDLRALRDHFGLQRLVVKDAPHLKSLSGVGELRALTILQIFLARQLREIDEVADLGPAPRELEFEDCPGIEAIDAVQSLINLRFLGVSECGEIASLAPVRSLRALETLYAWGSTRIVDDDLSPLGDLPRLKEIRMRNRRSYKPALDDILSAISRTGTPSAGAQDPDGLASPQGV
jgi:hypothetical protein